MLAECTRNIVKYTTGVDYRLFIHDDSAEEKGVAHGKNSCIGTLMRMNSDHVFLFDDDCWPTAEDWWRPYVESPEHHLSYLFEADWDPGHKLEEKGDLLLSWPHGNGCMLYYDRQCLEVVGGMRRCFDRYGNEHMEHSHRIHNTGLTDHVFQGLIAQKGMFHSADEHNKSGKTLTALDPKVRSEMQQRNPAFFEYWKNSKGFVPWD